MPWTYQCDTDKDVIYITASGVVTESDLAFGAAEILADRRLGPTTRTFNDYRATTGFQLSPEFVHAMGKTVGVQVIRSRRAYLVNDDVQLKAVNAYLNAVSSEWIRVFTDRSALLAWLNDGQPPERHIA